MLGAGFVVDSRTVGDNCAACSQRASDLWLVVAGIASGVQLNPTNVRQFAYCLGIGKTKSNVRCLQNLASRALSAVLIRGEDGKRMLADFFGKQIQLGLLVAAETVVAPDCQIAT